MADKLQPISDLSENTRRYLDQLLIGFRYKYGIAFELSEREYLDSMYQLLESQFVRIEFDGERFGLVTNV